MARNLDLVALRSFVAVADCGGITHAADQLHLSQSAVSMQIKRLEEDLDGNILQRRGRGVVLTPLGELLLGYARRLVALNDEAWTRLTDDDYEGVVSVGVPVDIMEPEVPAILKRCKQLYPRVRINLISSLTNDLRKRLSKGKVDIILTTELTLDTGGETLMVETNDWYGVQGGIAHLQRPLPIALCKNCAMRPSVTKTLDEADLAWVGIGDTDTEATVDALLSADLAVSPKLRRTTPNAVLLHDDALPELPPALINMYLSQQGDLRVERIANVIREIFSSNSAAA